jgi:hypothetical protein
VQADPNTNIQLKKNDSLQVGFSTMASQKSLLGLNLPDQHQQPMLSNQPSKQEDQ